MTLEGRDACICLVVTNRGPEIPAEVQRTIFEPFRRANNERSRCGGLGLGLYIVNEIVTAHGGR